MRQPKRVGIDLDGVLIDHRPHKLRLAQEHGVSLAPWQANSNIIRTFFEPEQYAALKDSIYGSLTREAPPVAGCIEALRAIKSHLYIVSARRSQSIRFAQDWLVKHRIYDIIPAERIVFCGSDDEKRGYCDRFALDMFLDDKVNVLDSLPGRTGRVLFDEDGVHSFLQLGDRLRAVKSWEEFRDHVDGRALT